MGGLVVNLTKKQLMVEMKLFVEDKDRGISINNFCEIVGISSRLFTYVFCELKFPMTEETQRKVNRAYNHWKEGRLRVMKKHTNETYPDYRKEPVQPLVHVTRIQPTAGGFKVQVGAINRHDYSNFSNILSTRG
jgi:hypothetical protein